MRLRELSSPRWHFGRVRFGGTRAAPSHSGPPESVKKKGVRARSCLETSSQEKKKKDLRHYPPVRKVFGARLGKIRKLPKNKQEEVKGEARKKRKRTRKEGNLRWSFEKTVPPLSARSIGRAFTGIALRFAYFTSRQPISGVITFTASRLTNQCRVRSEGGGV